MTATTTTTTTTAQNTLAKNFKMLICPACRSRLVAANNSLMCDGCGRIFRTNSNGFFEFVVDATAYEKAAVTHHYAEDQKATSVRLWSEFFKPLLAETSERVLDVGCGIGGMISLAQQQGFDAYGVDLPALSTFWAQAGNNPHRFFCCDAGRLPFPDNYFDVVWSLGVIEHIGTVTGHCTLAANYLEARQTYADEIVRVTKPRGRIIIACPNKHFPVDIQHGPSDEMTPHDLSARVRNRIFEHTGINVHAVTGKYHLASYAEIKTLFCGNGGARSIESLPLRNYFAFGRFQSGFLRRASTLAQAYVNNLPTFLRRTFMNPYVLVLITK